MINPPMPSAPSHSWSPYAVGAGIGEDVFFVRGREAALPFLPVSVPTDAAITGICDHWTTGDRSPLKRRRAAVSRGARKGGR